jgi:hypothetical protein
MAPTRVIEGQATKMGRTIHGIAYSASQDEIYASNPMAAAVLVYRGGASGNEAPMRMIQGPRTKLVYPHAVSIDDVNKEIFVMDRSAEKVLVFALNANGDVAPLRILQGPKTRFARVVGAAVDHERNLLVISATGSKEAGIYIFNRTDGGDVAPQRVIAGPKTGIGSTPWQLEIYRGKIYAAVVNDFYAPLYSHMKPRAGVSPDAAITSPWRSDRIGFIGVWNTTDKGDIAPRAIIRGPGSGIIHGAGIALNIKHKEIFAVDSVRNGLFTYLVPGFF